MAYKAEASADEAVQGGAVGLIIPPKEIRAIVDRTAKFVADHGPKFEERVKTKFEGVTDPANTHKFGFVLPASPFHPYYRARVEHFLSGGPEESAVEENKSAEGEEKARKDELERNLRAQPESRFKDVIGMARSAISRRLKQTEEEDPTPTLAFGNREFVHPSHLPPVEMDLIRLVARYTASGGRAFLSRLTEREANNVQYSFLRPTHALFGYFQALTDQYRAVYSRRRALLDDLERDGGWVEGKEAPGSLSRAILRAERKREQQERKMASDGAALSRVDWLRFTVVETIDLESENTEGWEAPKQFDALTGMVVGTVGPDGEVVRGGISSDRAAPTLPPVEKLPSLPSSNPAAAAAASDDEGSEMEDDDDDMSVDQEGAPPQHEAEDDDDEKIVVRTDYVPKAVDEDAVNSSGAFIDPQTGRLISVGQASQHVRIGLVDPQYRQDRARAIEKQRDTSYATGDDVAENLRRLAESRRDIFASDAAPSTQTDTNTVKAGAKRPAANDQTNPPPSKRRN